MSEPNTRPSVVLLSTLQPGEQFTAADGGRFTLVGPTPMSDTGAALPGRLFRVTPEGGESRLFSGFARVTRGWHEHGWLADVEIERDAFTTE